MDELRVLGPVEVVARGEPVSLPAMPRRLLAALVVAGGGVRPVDELVDALWGEEPPVSARKLLQQYVSQVRRVLPPSIRIDTRPGGYALSAETAAVDAVRFEGLLSDAIMARRQRNPALAASLAVQALALWRGRAFGDLGYDAALREPAERLEELRLAVTEERFEAELALGRHGWVVAEVLALADSNPLRERSQELAMLSLYRCGRQTEALDRYAALRRHLRDELGLEPGQVLRDLQQRILRQDPALDAPSVEDAAGRSLPIPATPLVGRLRELASLAALLERREARLIVIAGAGGSGKTRLALEAARAASGRFADGAVLVELAPLRDPLLVAATVAQALDVPESADETTEDALADALASRELLLVVDNAEHVREAAPLFARLVARAPRLTVVVTSRAVLHVSGEHVFPVAPLPEDDAVELFVQRARLLEPTFERSDDNEDALREICRRVDGLPLAIELAAARIRTLTPGMLLERLGGRLALLTAGPRDLPARQQTLRGTIDWSVELLSEIERRVLARLAVCPAGATLETTEAVCGGDVDSLAALCDGNVIVRRVEPSGDLRFGLLETIREYAYELLGDERATVERRLAEHLAALVDRAVLKGAGTEIWLPRLDAELDNLRAALAAAASVPDPELELRLAGGLWRYWWIRGSLTEGRERLTAALSRAAGPPSAARARALAGAAGLAFSQGDRAEAKRLATEAIWCAQVAGALYDESSAHVVLGVTANAERDWPAARIHLRRSIELSVMLGVEPVTEKLNLGITSLDSGDYPAAVELFEDVLASHRRNGSDEGIGFALLNLGLARHRLGDDLAAQRDFDEARERFAGLGFRAHVGHAVLGCAAIEARAGRHAEAARLLGAARAELGAIDWSADDFDPELARQVEERVRAALGDEAFESAYAVGAAD